MNPVIFSIGNFELKWYSTLILIGIIISFIMIIKEAKKFNINQDVIFNILFWTVVFGLLGARLYYVIFNFHLYTNNVVDILKVWKGGLAIHGGIFAGILVITYYSKKYNIKLLRLLDIASVPLILAQAIGRWGNFFNQEAFGAPTTLKHLQSLNIPKFIIDGMHINGIYYTPTFFYESLWCLIGFVILLIVRKLRFIKVGQIASIYLMWYSIGRFFIEASRTDSLMFMGFKIAQIVSVILFIIGLVIFITQIRKSKFEGLYNEEVETEKTRF